MNSYEQHDAKEDDVRDLPGLEQYLKKENRFWLERALMVSGKFSPAGESDKALALVLEGLSEEDQHNVINHLIEHEWNNAIRKSDTNTFMREPSLSKTALMYHFKNEFNKNPEKALEFIENPTKFIQELPIPDHLRAVLKGIVDAKVGQPMYGLAHNIVFAMISGPLLSHFKELSDKAKGTPDAKQASENLANATAASRLFTDTNRVLVQKVDPNDPNALNYFNQTIENAIKNNITPQKMISYVETLESMMSHITDKYPRSAISKEVVSNLVQLSDKIEGKKNPVVNTSEEKENKADENKTSSLKSEITKFIKELVKTLADTFKVARPSWTIKKSEASPSEANQKTNEAGLSSNSFKR